MKKSPYTGALCDAIQNGDTETCKRALDRGADPNATIVINNVELGGECTFYALHLAAARGYTDICALLLDHGANVHALSIAPAVFGDVPLYADAPLFSAAAFGHTDICALLLNRGADIHARDNSRNTPLHDAAKSSNPDTCALLLDRGADIHARNNSGETPLYSAAASGSAEICALLLSRGADPVRSYFVRRFLSKRQLFLNSTGAAAMDSAMVQTHSRYAAAFRVAFPDAKLPQIDAYLLAQ